MGQQQLLLIVLGAIIVGISVVIGINMFSSSSDQANIDAVRQDLLTIGSSAQSWYKRPEMMGGGGNSFNGLTFAKVAFPADTLYGSDKTAGNSNGTYTMTVTDTLVTVSGVCETADATLTGTIGPSQISVTGG